MLDMHTHILPGVDDGARDDACARAMLDAAARLGIDVIVATPHVYHAPFPEKARAAFAPAQALAAACGIRLVSGCEMSYRVLAEALGVSARDPNASMRALLRPYVIGETDCVLLELPRGALMPHWESLFGDLADAGIEPILAHLERCPYIQKDMGLAGELRAIGCEISIDAGGFMAGLLSPERRAARKLLERGCVDYIASDAHRPEDYRAMEQARKALGAAWPQGGRLTRALAIETKS